MPRSSKSTFCLAEMKSMSATETFQFFMEWWHLPATGLLSWCPFFQSVCSFPNEQRRTNVRAGCSKLGYAVALSAYNRTFRLRNDPTPQWCLTKFLRVANLLTRAEIKSTSLWWTTNWHLVRQTSSAEIFYPFNSEVFSAIRHAKRLYFIHGYPDTNWL